MRKIALIVVTLGCAAFVAGCGELPQATSYKQGQYRGKPDSQSWEGGDFKGDRVAWEKAIKARNNGQNEYARIAN
jgi:hypothetical protein